MKAQTFSNKYYVKDTHNSVKLHKLLILFKSNKIKRIHENYEKNLYSYQKINDFFYFSFIYRTNYGYHTKCYLRLVIKCVMLRQFGAMFLKIRINKIYFAVKCAYQKQIYIKANVRLMDLLNMIIIIFRFIDRTTDHTYTLSYTYTKMNDQVQSLFIFCF